MQKVKTMDLFDAIKKRRSVRAFQRKEVSDEQVRRLIDAARHAPSAGNIQPWEFIIIRDLAVKKQLSIAASDQTFIEEASVVIVICADEARSAQGYGRRGQSLFCIQDTAAATENLLLGASAMGLGACWVGAFQEDIVRKTLKTPTQVRPVAIVPIGYPAEHPRQRGRRSIREIVHKDGF